MRIVVLPLGELQTNCWLIVDEQHGQLAIVDPGGDSARLLAAVNETGATPVAVWLTHAHFDHVGAVADVVRAFGIPVYLHPDDLPLYRAAARQAAAYGLRVDQPEAEPVSMHDGDNLRVGGLSFEVIHAPGHAPGHVVLHGHGIAIVGDCIFAGSVGRTDLPFADSRMLAASLERIAALPPATRVLPGHGPETTIAAERQTNPFLTGAARLVAS